MTTDDLLAGRYRTLRVIGTGGMARVFLAEDERLGRQVAVKRLHAHSPEDSARRFQREARLGASLNHPNLVSVYDVETDGESVLIVMEYVEGTTLAGELRTGPLDPDRAVSVLADVAAALDAVHDKGIVHRDVKPANVLIRTDGVAKLADLGIATLAEGTSITASGTVLGTASYMAPEQVRGETAGPGADVYALAVVAFEAFSGQRAQTGDTPVQVAHSITDGPRDIRESWPEAPAALAQALLRGMAPRPEDRHLRAGDLAGEIRSALEGGRQDATVAAAPTAPTALTRPAAPDPAAAVSRHRGRSFPLAPVALAAAAVVVAVLAFALLGSGGGDDEASRQETAASKPQATETTPAPASTTPVTTTPAAEPPETEPEPAPASGSAAAARLNDRGYALLKGGDAAGAVPVLQQAVAAFPADSTELNHAYALFNLAQALRMTGRPAEAVPLLEKRLSFSDNQRKTVEKELQLARKQAGTEEGKPGGKKEGKKNED